MSLVKPSDVIDLIIKGVQMGSDLSKDVEKLTAKDKKVPAYNLDQLTDDIAITLKAKGEGKTINQAVDILQGRNVPDSVVLKIIGKIYGGK